MLTFRLNYLLGGFQPWGYHLVNVLLHCLATALLVRVARHVLPKTKSSVGPAVTGLIFAVHPIHTEAVAGVVGRADLAACNFYLLAFLAYIFHAKYRDYACCEHVVKDRVEQIGEDKQKQHRAFRYHRFVVSLQRNVTNCNWTRRLGKDVLVHSQASVAGVRRTSPDAEGAFIVCCWKRSNQAWGCLMLTVLLGVAAMLSKETGITVLGVCAVYDLLYLPHVHKVRNSFLCFCYYCEYRFQFCQNTQILFLLFAGQ